LYINPSKIYVMNEILIRLIWYWIILYLCYNSY
jgi:hypothetical protein